MLTPLEAACFPFLSESKALLESLELDLNIENPRTRAILEAAKKILVSVPNSHPDFTIGEEKPWLQLATFHALFAALKFSQNTSLKRLFAQREAKKATIRFLSSQSSALRLKVVRELCSSRILEGTVMEAGKVYTISMPVWDYLACLGNMRARRLRLVNRPLRNGLVHLQNQELARILEERVLQLIEKKLENRVTQLPPPTLRQLISLADQQQVKQNPPRHISSEESTEEPIPAIVAKHSKKSGETRDRYRYVEQLLQKPVSNGRNRLVWLVITPYLVNVKKLDVKSAAEATVEYLTKCGWTERHLERLAAYHCLRAKRIGLKPPRLENLARKDPHLYKIVRGAQT